MEFELNPASLSQNSKAAVLDNFYPAVAPDVSNSRISIFGAGYVGCVSAACLSNDGFQVVAVDPDQFKVERLAKGQAPIVEPGLVELLDHGHHSDLLSATQSAR